MKLTNKDLNALPLSIKLKVDLSMKYILTLLFLFNTMIAFSQTEEVIEDSMPVIENVVIYKDARLDLLDKRPPLMAKLEMEDKAKAEKAMTNYKPIVSASGKKKVTGSIYTTKGFRIIIYNGSDRAMAMEAKNKPLSNYYLFKPKPNGKSIQNSSLNVLYFEEGKLRRY